MILLLEPTPERDLPSGGYRYNRAVGDWLELQDLGGRRRVSPPGLDEVARSHGAALLVDALFGGEAAPALEAAQEGHVLLHWLPFDAPDLSREDRDRLRSELDRLIRVAKSVVVTAASTARRVREIWPGLPVSTVCPAVDDIFHQASHLSTDDTPTIVCVGAITPLKGQHVVAAAAASAPFPCRLLLVGEAGDPSYLDAIDQAARDAEVIVTGPLPPAGVAAALSRATIYASASRLESFGMANLEAVTVGTPVVLTHVGDVAAHVRASGGAVVAPGDDDAFIRAVHEALQSRLPPPPFPERTWDQVGDELRRAMTQ